MTSLRGAFSAPVVAKNSIRQAQLTRCPKRCRLFRALRESPHGFRARYQAMLAWSVVRTDAKGAISPASWVRLKLRREKDPALRLRVVRNDGAICRPAQARSPDRVLAAERRAFPERPWPVTSACENPGSNEGKPLACQHPVLPCGRAPLRVAARSGRFCSMRVIAASFPLAPHGAARRFLYTGFHMGAGRGTTNHGDTTLPNCGHGCLPS